MALGAERVHSVDAGPQGMVAMSEKRIGASSANPRNGYRVTSQASSGVRHGARKVPARARRPVLREVAPGPA